MELMIVETSDRRHAVEVDPEHKMFGWVFRRGPDPGQWVSVRQATIDEVRGAMLRAKRLPEATQDLRPEAPSADQREKP